MSKKDEALKLALGELQAGKVGNAMQILREALAEQPAQQEPVAWVQPNGHLVVRADYGGRLYYSEQNLYASQPASKPLTDEQIMEMYNEPRSDAEMIAFARAIEAKLREKNA